jgi:plastocyanin
MARTRNVLRGLALALGTLAALAALISPALAAKSSTKIVKAQNFAFSPKRTVIHRGDRVTWRFLDAALRSKHNVTSVGAKRFKSSTDTLTGSYTVRFSRAGTYRYMCTIHPASMSGTIVVR